LTRKELKREDEVDEEASLGIEGKSKANTVTETQVRQDMGEGREEETEGRKKV
jgi:hypothetical protein